MSKLRIGMTRLARGIIASLAAAILLSGGTLGAVQLQNSIEPVQAIADPVTIHPPAVVARSVVIMDAATGTLLFTKNPDLVIPPASLAKLVTLHVVYQEIAAGHLTKDELVTIDKRDCPPFIPYGSSLMYLRPGMRVSVLDLMRGAAVFSGNDAAFSLARRISGSNEAFAALMNQSVRALGLTQMYFVEPSGLSELNRTSALEFSLFCKAYLHLHPESLGELHSIRSIEFPRAEHATADWKPEGRTILRNRNDLVLSYEGCDGLKTGYIVEAGYNLAATARRGDTRFIVITLGGDGIGAAGGGASQRKFDGAALLDWSFLSFETSRPALPPFKAVRTWYGQSERISCEPDGELAVSLPRRLSGEIQVRVELPVAVDAPLAKGRILGEVIYSANGEVLRRVDLVAPHDVLAGNIFIYIRDAIAKFFVGLFGLAP